ncbi:hypothetical protein OMW55_07250 [Sphingomonas sp. BN140010]|uniref:Uncharacterized protein n=1 Tax=Sphingomonas arvum TaxID=2992113 RepID=A0ABT3JEU9_9SPHN|nr:hypothetical protein [Sphingomonas sp. BN140010]MCW3797598.1 hypothetical protein [Sphingomonas sp. BN140010]
MGVKFLEKLKTILITPEAIQILDYRDVDFAGVDGSDHHWSPG